MNTIGACSIGSSQAASADANEYYLSASATIDIFSSDWKLITKPAIFIEGLPPIIPMNVLVLQLLLAGFTATFLSSFLLPILYF